MATYNQVGYGSTDKETVTELQRLLNQNGSYNLDEDGIFGDKTLAAVKDYQKNNKLSVDGIVGKNTWGALTGGQSNSSGASTPAAPAETAAPTFEYKPSDTVAQADALLQQHLANKPGEWQGGQWNEQLNDTIAQILNREKFSYDLNSDALYQQYKDQYITQGKLAMMDTMGQAQAMTGGYGNSYAQSVGQQAYQAYLQQLNDVVPELYGMALDQYNQEGQELYSQASLMAQMDEQEYGRYRDTVADYYSDLSYLTENSRYMSETEYQKALDAFNIKYGVYRDEISDKQWQAQFDEAKRQYDQQYALSTSKGSSGGGGTTYTAPSGWDTAAIKAFQTANGLTADGIWGPKTQAAYEAYIAGNTGTEPAKGWDDFNQETYKANIEANGGSYYERTLQALTDMKKMGYTKDQAMAYLLEARGNSFISTSEYMTLVQKCRNMFVVPIVHVGGSN